MSSKEPRSRDAALDAERFRHDRSPYERPVTKLRCGRGALWGNPCLRGPNADGTCGGTSECGPVKTASGRFECRRPLAAGGPCAEGPMPDGRCSRRQPPCTPRSTMRHVRGRLTLLAVGLVLALIAGFSSDVRIGGPGVNLVDPGPLFGSHAGFAPLGNCAACHEPHGSKGSVWTAAFTDDADMTDRCLSCHTFAGNPRSAHNAAFPERPDMGQISCNVCHTEHKGADADLAKLTDAQCASCHLDKFDEFPREHPAFPAKFPNFQEASIKFDHARHIGVHFGDAKVADKAPTSCASCHDVVTAESAVVPKGFAETCAACHGTQIAQRDMVVLRFPELESSEIDREAVLEVCGPTLDQFERLRERMDAMAAGDTAPEEEEGEEFESVSSEELTPVASYLLGVATDDMEAYSTPMQDLVMGMAEEGAAPLASLIDEKFGKPLSAKLLLGLSPEVVKRLSCAWAANVEYEAPADPEMGGWFGDGLDLLYRPTGHADPVMQGWIEASLEAGATGDEQAAALRDELIGPDEGPGSCVKCHAVKAVGEDPASEQRLGIAWRFQRDNDRPYDRYSHRAHINLVQATSASMSTVSVGCRFCHKLNTEADFMASFSDYDPRTFQSNFQGIRIETCAQCHRKDEVRQDCQLCHRYHLEPTFTPEMMGADMYQE